MTRSLLFVAHTGQRSGAEKVMLNLVDLALERGLRVVVACPDGPLAGALPDSCAHIPIPLLGLRGETGWRRLAGLAGLPMRWLVASRRIRQNLYSEHVRVVCNSLFALPSVRLAVLGTSWRERVSWLVHDTMSSRRQRVVARAGRAGVGTAVAVSRATAAPVRDAGFPVVVAPNGVPLGPSSAMVCRPAPSGRIGILATVTEWKGHRVLLEAVARISDVHLDVAGAPFPGDEMFLDELRARAERPDLRGRVSFLGQVHSERVLGTWDVMVSASTSPEAGPLGVLEAMARGVPVIGTDHGGAAEYLADGAGVLVPPGDAGALAEALRRVLGDAGLRCELVRTARRRVEAHYDLDTTLPAMADVLWGSNSVAI